MVSKALMHIDTRMSTGLQNIAKVTWIEGIAKVIARSGDAWFWFPGLLGYWWINYGVARIWPQRLILAMLVTLAGVHAVKLCCKRQRPEGSWGDWYRKVDPYSFPSGHAARAGVLLGISYFFGPAWFFFCMLVYSPLLALSRVITGLHYCSDILFGFFIGIVVATIIMFITYYVS